MRKGLHVGLFFGVIFVCVHNAEMIPCKNVSCQCHAESIPIQQQQKMIPDRFSHNYKELLCMRAVFIYCAYEKHWYFPRNSGEHHYGMFVGGFFFQGVLAHYTTLRDFIALYFIERCVPVFLRNNAKTACRSGFHRGHPVALHREIRVRLHLLS